jgi:hypothetical protein
MKLKLMFLVQVIPSQVGWPLGLERNSWGSIMSLHGVLGQLGEHLSRRARWMHIKEEIDRCLCMDYCESVLRGSGLSLQVWNSTTTLLTSLQSGLRRR